MNNDEREIWVVEGCLKVTVPTQPTSFGAADEEHAKKLAEYVYKDETDYQVTNVYRLKDLPEQADRITEEAIQKNIEATDILMEEMANDEEESESTEETVH